MVAKNFFNHFFKNLFIFREKKGEGKREEEKHQCVAASCTPPTGDLACNPGLCPDWESNWQPFGSQAGPQPTEPHHPGLLLFFLIVVKIHIRFAILTILSV